MTKAKYIACDTETGGLDCTKHSLLSFYASFLDENLEQVDELDLILIPDDRIMHIDAEALGYNKLDLQAHIKKAVKYIEGRNKLLNKLTYHSLYGANPLALIGQNCHFDINFIKEYLLPEEEYHKFLGHGYIDTKSIALFLKMKNKLPANLSSSLRTLAKHFNVKIDKKDDESFHTASFDTKVTVEVLKSLLLVE